MSEETTMRRASQGKTKQFLDQYMLGVVARRNKNYESCINILTKALEDGVGSDALEYSGRDFLGDVFLENGEAKLALEQFSRCLEIKPKDSTALCKQGLCYLDMNDFETAKIHFLNSVEVNSVDNAYSAISRPYYELCILYRKDGTLEKSKDVIEEALRLDEKNVFYQCEKLLLGAQIENSFDEALLEIDSIIEMNLKKEDVFAYPYYIKGICLQVKEAYQEAHECLKKAVEVRVDYRRVKEYELCINRGNYGYMSGKFEESVADFLHAKELIEKTKIGEFTCYDHDKLGSCYFELGEIEKAIECFQTAIGMKEVCHFYENLGGCRMIWSQDNEDEFGKAAMYYYKALQTPDGLESFQSFENLGYISEFFTDSMRGENVLMNMCRSMNPPANLEQVLFISKEMDLDPMAKNEYDRNLIMYVLMNPNGISMDVISKLIEETEIDVHEVDQKERWNIAHHAVNNVSVNVDVLKFISELLEEYEFKELDNLDRSILHIHCSNKNTKLDVLKYLVEEINVHIDEPDVDGRNALHHLCNNNPENIECIVYLIKKGVKLDEDDQEGKKPLDYLSEETREKVMKQKEEEE